MAVLDHVRGLLADGTLRPGMATPTTGALGKKLGCHRQTAGKALRLLFDEGVLVRYPGPGYFVSWEPEACNGGPGELP